jgi:hypothetical protein
LEHTTGELICDPIAISYQQTLYSSVYFPCSCADLFGVAATQVPSRVVAQSLELDMTYSLSDYHPCLLYRRDQHRLHNAFVNFF